MDLLPIDVLICQYSSCVVPVECL